MMETTLHLKERLGKRLAIGETFVTVTKRMKKDRSNCRPNKELNGPFITYEVLRRGDERFFVKGKRNYRCIVIALVETRCGLGYWLHTSRGSYENFEASERTRWWQFSYLVKIIEN